MPTDTTDPAVLRPASPQRELATVHLLASLRAGSAFERVTRLLSETASLRSLLVAPGERPGCLRLSAWVECPAGEIADLLGALGFVRGLEGLEWTVAEPRRAREYALLEVAATGEARSRVIEVASVFRGRVVDACEGSLTLELSGLPDELDAAFELLGELGISRMLRTGPLALGA